MNAKKKRAAVGQLRASWAVAVGVFYDPWPWQKEEFSETLRKGPVTHSGPQKSWGQETGGKKRENVPSPCPPQSRESLPLLLVWKEAQGQIRNVILFLSLCLSVKKRWGLRVECVSQEQEEWKGSMRKREGYPAAILHGLITGNKACMPDTSTPPHSHHILNHCLAD